MYERVDEILAGATVALIFAHFPKGKIPSYVTVGLFPVALLASHQSGGFLCYLRPYIVATMVGPAFTRRLP
jgi:hypothetical protein